MNVIIRNSQSKQRSKTLDFRLSWKGRYHILVLTAPVAYELHITAAKELDNDHSLSLLGSAPGWYKAINKDSQDRSRITGQGSCTWAHNMTVYTYTPVWIHKRQGKQLHTPAQCACQEGWNGYACLIPALPVLHRTNTEFLNTFAQFLTPGISSSWCLHCHTEVTSTHSSQKEW